MKRFLTVLGLAGLLACFAPVSMLALDDSAGGAGGLHLLRPNPNVRGWLVIEVLEIGDLSPVAGVRVELLPSGRTLRTGANGRAVFALPPGEYDLRVHDLTGPGPAIRVDEVHAHVVARESVLIQVLDCGACL